MEKAALISVSPFLLPKIGIERRLSLGLLGLAS